MTDFHFTKVDWTAHEWQLAGRALELLSKNKEAGFLSEASNDSMWRAVQARAEKISSAVDQTIVVGIGGSSLGAKALISLAATTMPVFLEGLDPETVGRTLNALKDLKRTHWLWISKSGATLETLTNLERVVKLYESRNLNLCEFSTVISQDADGPLQDWARKNKVERLFVPADVSGRFSVFSPVGLLPAVLSGVDLKSVRQGVENALAAREIAQKVISATLSSWRRQEWVTLLWTYGDRLHPVVRWLQQLWAESLAKSETRDKKPAPRVSFPVPCAGSPDQHSILQQVMEGARDKWVWIFRLKSLESQGEVFAKTSLPAMKMIEGRTLGQIFSAQAEGTARAFEEAGLHVLECSLPRADGFEAGFHLFLLEIVVAALGECLNINAFNQPGVERGKTLTQTILRKSLF